jgi:hypothetical protein
MKYKMSMILTLWLAAIGPVLGAEPMPELLRQGLFEEEANRNLRKAIENYQEGIIEPIAYLNMAENPGELHEGLPDDVPSLNTLGYGEGGQQVVNMYPTARPIVAPPDVPDERADILEGAYGNAITGDDFTGELASMNAEVEYMNGGEAQEFLEGQIDSWQDNEDLLELIFGE